MANSDTRLTYTLQEIIYSEDCPSDLRSTLDNVLELNKKVCDEMDYSEWEQYILSDEFRDDVYEMFGFDIGEPE